jgi:hypothetical protein
VSAFRCRGGRRRPSSPPASRPRLPGRELARRGERGGEELKQIGVRVPGGPDGLARQQELAERAVVPGRGRRYRPPGEPRGLRVGVGVEGTLGPAASRTSRGFVTGLERTRLVPAAIPPSAADDPAGARRAGPSASGNRRRCVPVGLRAAVRFSGGRSSGLSHPPNGAGLPGAIGSGTVPAGLRVPSPGRPFGGAGSVTVDGMPEPGGDVVWQGRMRRVQA